MRDCSLYDLRDIMGSQVQQKFREWTEGLDTRQSMISIFYHIRDIPYTIVTDPGFHDPERGPETILEAGSGSCAPKHYLLATMYRKLNVNVVYATFPFLWGDQEIQYPDRLRDQAKHLPVAYHLACRVQIGCRWALIDATWDPPLGKAGFPVNAHWDGIADTRCAVLPLNAPPRATLQSVQEEDSSPKCEPWPVSSGWEKDHWEADDRERYYREMVGRRTEEDVQRTRRFYRELNEWMVQVRRPEYR